MCGVTGFFEAEVRSSRSAIQNMCSQLTHRGPDDTGCWVDESAGLALGHRRLSILDLSVVGQDTLGVELDAEKIGRAHV